MTIVIIECIAAVASFVATNLIHSRMIALVNLKLPEARRFPSNFGSGATWGHATTRLVHREYRKLYPDGQLIRSYWLLVAVMFISFLLFVGHVHFHRLGTN